MHPKAITRADVLDMDAYEKVRKDKRAALLETKRNRRVEVGPHAIYLFENYETMWAQVHEMLRIEKGGEAQIPDELEAYNTLIPQGRELVATVMFQIDDPVRRRAFLSKLGGIEETCFLTIDGEEVIAVPEEDVDRTTADGKASSVQYVHFTLSDAQAEKMKAAGTALTVGFKHPAYAHMARLSEPVRAELARDLD